jgi:SAM-dependent methyltransferase
MTTDSEHITELSPERASPSEMAGRLMESEHRGRYWWAAQLAEGRAVLDAGCGTGYGTEILAAAGAESVVGVDISQEAIDSARAAFLRPSSEFSLADLHELPFEEGAFDLAACFEVIEHVEEQQSVIRELHRVLRTAGVLAISSPNRDVYPPGNPHHIHEYVPEELEQALGKEFAHVKLYRQSPWLTAAVLDDAASQAVGREAESSLDVIKTLSVEPGAETFTVALASDAELPNPNGLVVMGAPFEVAWWEEQLQRVARERDQEQAVYERERTEHERQRAEAERERAEHERRHRELGRALLAAETGLANARNEIAQLLAAEVDLKRWADKEKELMRRRGEAAQDFEKAAQDFENRLRRAERTMDDITSSVSWRVTKPLRAVKRVLRR